MSVTLAILAFAFIYCAISLANQDRKRGISPNSLSDLALAMRVGSLFMFVVCVIAAVVTAL